MSVDYVQWKVLDPLYMSSYLLSEELHKVNFIIHIKKNRNVRQTKVNLLTQSCRAGMFIGLGIWTVSVTPKAALFRQ